VRRCLTALDGEPSADWALGIFCGGPYSIDNTALARPSHLDNLFPYGHGSLGLQQAMVTGMDGRGCPAKQAAHPASGRLARSYSNSLQQCF
jgi:hypothetical protein